jgi:hypothetical protein
MTAPAVSDARRFVQDASIPEPAGVSDELGPFRGAEAAEPQPLSAILETGKEQAAVVGSDIVAFVSGVTAERREAIINSSLLAQLIASSKVADQKKIYDWYREYFKVLSNIGWVTQQTSFAEYREQQDNFTAHEAILKIAATLLGPASTALALVTSTVQALKSMDKSTPWLTIFNRESQRAETAHFQVSLAEQDPAGQFFVTVMAFGLEASSTITQVLVFKVKRNQAQLKHFSGKVTINTGVLDSIRQDLQAKLVGHASSYVRALPDVAAHV